MAKPDMVIISDAYSTLTPTALTMKRDVSDLLDLWAHRDTPFLNRIKWGSGSGGLSREWLSEHLGFGYIQTSGAIASNGTSFVPTTSGTGLTTAEVIKQVGIGTLLYAHVTGDDASGRWMSVTSVSTDAIDFSELVNTSAAIAASAKIYIVGHFVNEGSDPFPDTSRTRAILTNNFTILRKDIKITGSQAATDMYAVGNEPTHQMAMRLLEMQFERERSLLYSYTETRAAGTPGLMNGVAGYFRANSITGDHVDSSTTALTESAFNDVVAACWENGGTPNVFVGNVKQMRLFTDWDDSKIRTRPNARLGGHWITSYLCDTGIEIDLVPLRHAPMNYGFVLDTNLISLIPKQGRKLIIEKAAAAARDYDLWMLLSEYTMELRKYDQGAHGIFEVLQ